MCEENKSAFRNLVMFYVANQILENKNDATEQVVNSLLSKLHWLCFRD